MKKSFVLFSHKHGALDFYRNEIKTGVMLNSSKITKEDFENLLDIKLIKIPWCDKGYVIDEHEKLIALKSLSIDSGLFHVADPKELYPISLLDIQPGHKVLDVFSCASGVRTIQAGLFLENKGLLVANSENKAKTIKTTNKLQTFGITNFISINSGHEKLLKSNKDSFDRIMVTPTKDHKDEETNYMKMPIKVRKLKLTENTKKIYNLLDNSLSMLKHGGKLLYSAKGNSFLEEKYALNKILNAHKNVYIGKIDSEYDAKMVISDKYSSEKMYILVLEKLISENYNNLDNKAYQEYNNEITPYIAFEKKYMNITLEDKVVRNNNKFYILPEHAINTENVDVRNTGSVIGFLKYDNFTPSHALSCILKKEDFKNYYEFDFKSDEYKKYINNISFKATIKSDIYLIGCMGYPIGWGRVRNGLFFNITKKFVK
ncbi:MAG: hypothetical protein A2Y18_02475 [Clostridiales bacterium GWD2_32_19]|nr:MAG: hypothetical protein A2Y18_02475 [Clostridiales bacterium GWD2_32_19]